MYRNYIKRLLDLVFSIVLLPFFAVLLVIVAPLIKFTDRGPVFYNADRIGLNGKIFKMFKFRSMRVNAPDIRNEDGTTFNSENDPRVTRIGKTLRKTSIDEVPQLLNVLIGDMSWIGSRPDLPDALDVYSDEDRKKLSVRPGITGYSQAYYRNSAEFSQKMKGDVYYAENVSFLLDLKILIKTMQTVLKRDNLYRN
ncbi:MAG: sugar transferase [Lachnospiraceae bacterium]|nr:sugar transferase [Lachnospiraceae bacterium]